MGGMASRQEKATGRAPGAAVARETDAAARARRRKRIVNAEQKKAVWGRMLHRGEVYKNLMCF
jgi:hypothetical protein